MQILVKIGLVTLGMALTPPQNTQEYLQRLVGQRLILRHEAGSSDPKVKEKDLSNMKGGCDEAVEVTAIDFEKSAIHLQLRNIGQPYVERRNMSCPKTENKANVRRDLYSLKIVEFDIDQPIDQAEKALGYVLQTPEAYLDSLGVLWNPSDNESPVDTSRPGVTNTKPLLVVVPYYPAESRRVGIEGKVIMKCVIGTDGLVHDPVLVKGLSNELNKLALDGMSFYRYQPARKGGRSVAVDSTLETSFNLH